MDVVGATGGIATDFESVDVNGAAFLLDVSLMADSVPDAARRGSVGSHRERGVASDLKSASAVRSDANGLDIVRGCNAEVGGGIEECDISAGGISSTTPIATGGPFAAGNTDKVDVDSQGGIGKDDGHCQQPAA